MELNALTATANNNKRKLKSRREEDKEKPDAVVKKNWKAGFDDCHTIFNWEARREYSQPNADPRDYWPATQYVHTKLQGQFVCEPLGPIVHLQQG